MHITWIGGVERNATELVKIAEREGHELEVHSGHVSGRGAGTIEAAVARADLVLILTDVNSHGAVHIAKKTCRKLGKPSMVVRGAGRSRFEQLLHELRAA